MSNRFLFEVDSLKPQPVNPFSAPKTELQKMIVSKHSEVVRFARAHRESIDGKQAAQAALATAEAALNAEIARGAAKGRPNEQLERKLSSEVASLREFASDGVQFAKMQAAHNAYVAAYHDFSGAIATHRTALLAELAPEAEDVARRWHEAHERHLSGIEAEHAALADTTRRLVEDLGVGTDRIYARAVLPPVVPSDPRVPPVPDFDQYAREQEAARLPVVGFQFG